jgi:tetraacyldisaccharide 4'-kinase
LTDVYGTLTHWRRRWYARHPESRKRLSRPVISVGSLAFGGRSKTPTVAHLARLLVNRGHRPAILTRGYARTRPLDGAVVVRDHAHLTADLPRAGDEPMMLARSLDDTIVVVSPDRYLAGRLAEIRLGATVHVLDDGFQHLGLERDVDLVLAQRTDLEVAARPPAREPMRERPAAAAEADAVILIDEGADLDAAKLRVKKMFTLSRQIDWPCLLEPARGRMPRAAKRVVAVAGIAAPDRFFNQLGEAGWEIAEALPFPDHHPFSRSDVERITSVWRDTKADIVLTTEKDGIRLRPLRPIEALIAVVPLTVTIEPAEEFAAWLDERLGGREPLPR